MKVYQVYDEADPAATDTYVRTKKDAAAVRKYFLQPSPVLEHDILTSKGGLIDALTTIPMRNLPSKEEEIAPEPEPEPEIEW